MSRKLEGGHAAIEDALCPIAEWRRNMGGDLVDQHSMTGYYQREGKLEIDTWSFNMSTNPLTVTPRGNVRLIISMPILASAGVAAS